MEDCTLAGQILIYLDHFKALCEVCCSPAWLSVMVILLFAVPRPARADSAALIIEHCSVFDSESGRMLPDRTVLVAGDRIAAVARAGTALKRPPGTVRIDGRGKF